MAVTTDSLLDGARNPHSRIAAAMTDGPLGDWDAFSAACWAVQETLERIEPDLGSGPINHSIRCLTCDQTGMEALDREPPDTDRHGNMTWSYRCPGCGERCRRTTDGWGPDRISAGFELTDTDDT